MFDCSHALRGNTHLGRSSVPFMDAERPKFLSHAGAWDDANV